jgi:tetratricopeptide (TPR) repeat protein
MQNMIKYRKTCIIFIVIVALIIGTLTGIYIQKRLSYSNAFAFWVLGGQSLKKGEYDQALIYAIQAIALKDDEPLFYLSAGEIYEIKGNLTMAKIFYEAALEKYKENMNNSKIKFVEEKINSLHNK